MRQRALLMRGTLRADGTINIEQFAHPIDLEVPWVQRFFMIRNGDAELLRQLADPFLQAMTGQVWKFRMSVSFHDDGHLQYTHWKSRYILWCSALEALYTSENPGHRGSLVAKERIKWFLGENTPLYPPGDIENYQTPCNLTVRDVLDDLYELRNLLAHGSKIEDRFFRVSVRETAEHRLNLIEMLWEAVSFIVRASLIRILQDNLLHHFADSAAADAYFGGAGLTGPLLQTAKRKWP